MRLSLTILLCGFINFVIAQNQPVVHNYSELSVLSPEAFEVIEGKYQWVVSNATLSRSTDFGRTWINIVEGSAHSDISFVNKDVGYIVGQLGRVYKSTDGGATITNVFNLNQDWLYAVFFISETEGWVGGSSFGDIYHTSDGGLNWFPQSLTTDGKGISVEEIQFSGQTGHVLINKLSGTYSMYNTIDGGTNWNFSDIGSEELTSMEFKGSNIWVGGGQPSGISGVYSDAVIYKSVDGGAVWSKTSLGIESKIIAISFADDQNGWISLSNGALYKTNDGGQNWEEYAIESDFPGNWNSQLLSALDSDHLWLTVIDQFPNFPIRGSYSALIGNLPRMGMSFGDLVINNNDEISVTNHKDSDQIDSIFLINKGQKDLTVSNVEFTNLNFSHSLSTPFTILPGDSIELIVDIIATDVGELETDLTVTSNDELDELFFAKVSVAIINPELELVFDSISINTGDTITFDGSTVGQGGLETLVMSNSGETDLEAKVTIIEGGFDLSGTGIFTVASASEGTITLTHPIDVAGKLDGIMKINSNDFDEGEMIVYLSTCVNPSTPTITTTELDNSVQLTSSSTSGNEWFMDGNIIPTETGESIVVTEGGAYQVKTTIDGCSSQLSEAVEILITDIQNGITPEIEIYPSLAREFIYLSTKNIDKPGKILIYGAMGTKHMEIGLSNQGTHVIEIRTLRKGVYLLFYESKEYQLIKRFVKL